MALHPELNGHIIHISGAPELYWIDGGRARHIADEATYHGVFGGSPQSEAYDGLRSITTGPDVVPGTVLVRPNNWSEIYLIDNKTKRPIPNEQLKGKYQLNGNVHSVPVNAVESIPDGPSFA
ncbi:hypothetical protein [Granulicella arctica]|uniref:hypothetical protein n=1 Tax=Granulicella arctica TaxID=940613 RepID=UPI0021E06669|nr:hypothetical protein [Granulicella arctica]